MKENRREIGIYITCPECESNYAVEVNSDDYIEYKTTEKTIDECFPYLGEYEKLMLVDNICPDCRIEEDEENNG